MSVIIVHNMNEVKYDAWYSLMVRLLQRMRIWWNENELGIEMGWNENGLGI